ncbi:MAG: hypothetical protein SH856_03980 [Flavobacteriales bacterium]|nr:hypothetical protein [Flavobacteriales bacterium]
MKKLSALALLVFIFAKANSQTPSLWLLDPDTGWQASSIMIRMDASVMLQSRHLDLAFLDKLAFGGNISATHIDNISQRLDFRNGAGASAVGGLSIYSFADSLFGKSHIGMHFKASSNYDAQLLFTHNAFDLIFQGNEMFRGRTAAVGSFFQTQAFQKFGVGMFDKRTMSEVTLSYVNGQSFDRLLINDGEFYTSPLGDTLSLLYQGEYWRSDTSQAGFAVGDGQGAALDFSVNLGMITLGVRNAGFIQWNPNFERFQFDSSTVWTGFEVDDLFELTTDTLGLPQLEDTIEYTVKRGNFITGLPAAYNVRVLGKIGRRNFGEFGMEIQPNLVALPMVYGAFTVVPSPHHYFTFRIATGGYGGFRIGWDYQFKTNRNFYMRIGTENFPGILSKHSRGASGFVTIIQHFGNSTKHD